MLFSLQNAQKVSRPGFTAYVYNSKEEHPGLNTVYVDCFAGHEKVYVKNSRRLYFVIEGEGIFHLNGEEHAVRPNDVVVIEPMAEYAYTGKMKLFEVNCPATGSEDEVEVT
ncbi:MAG: Cupin 2 domain-containing protein [Candidatus Magasanikbacteria bacterium GW2011_GWA2_56_11]|uniref:Cupin 2 domain-containing protein n=1 Tax=Candidatus Magasanikbacteria bacterium GW2011_GWA2_56_11 TaxID=1619044 RepID=A0A0G1YF07_9BACT|nr:MAG: Cupin 2 domain-containing protein [Candidatus Magasanikbacteria bacterium GW2011_GWA2_56_11]